MSADEQSPTMERADSDIDEDDYAAEEQQSDVDGDSAVDEEGESQQDPSLRPIELKMQHGAHRNWGLREKHHVHKAKGGLPIQDGYQLGNLLYSRSGKVWSHVMYHHIDLVGGVPLLGGEQQLAPHVRFITPEGSPETDDAVWLRPVHAKVMEFLQPLWRQAIDKIKDDVKRQRVLDYYKPVLEWTSAQLNGPRLDPVAMGTGERGFILLTKPLKSILVRPRVQPRKASLEGGESSGSKKQKADSSVDTESMQEDLPFESVGEGSGVWRLGEVGKVHTFNGIDGCVYAAQLP